MNISSDIARSFPGERVGTKFASKELVEAKVELDEMIAKAGLVGKVVSVITPDNTLGARARGRGGQHLLTLWGRLPSSDAPAVSRLVGEAEEKFGSIFRALDGRCGAEDDIVLSHRLLHSNDPLPPRGWR